MNLGPAEILVVLVVALVVFGPARLPEISRQIGTAMREVRRVQESVRQELADVMQEEHPTASDMTAQPPSPSPSDESAARGEAPEPEVHPGPSSWPESFN